ncbi:PDDEXK nuclease domain-containing protein [Candidatus Cetobacterium colombiensis]|uniref:PDDEXK nuclease domain-containing protein n=1 Tax=Candidatus Cetobacterium colombiensis TaxID=3073100 RepID=A0ABU4WD00_9FUSO|nr:PDDEXK nuclease domain-containing protein [Candidatus Cetobacterium colombiensis]MDX8337407.1 PDDEXK nuclease domain-containing protein [Candidatus Cetobacterium colombiensis]
MEYISLLEELKNKIKISQNRAILSVNKELIFLYYEIGKIILKNQSQKGWGSKIIENLAEDLRKEFPNMKGLSLRNLRYMRLFAKSYPVEIVQQSVALLSWGHNIVLLDKVSSNKREWYAKKALENGWSRNVMVHQIESNLYERMLLEGKTHNFSQTLPDKNSELAAETLKDPYIFDFLNLSESYLEKELEDSLVENITKFLLELGKGFAYVGRQYHLEVGGEDFYIDLLFYHLKLRSYIVIELKTGKFKPEYAGKMNFYLSAVDDLLKHKDDNKSIGIILCKDKNTTIAEYALRDNSKPIGVSEYRLSLPAELAKELPTVEQLTKLGKNIESFNKYDNQILEFLEKEETATTKEISEILNLSDRRVRDILKDLQNKNLIKKIGKGPATCYILK